MGFSNENLAVNTVLISKNVSYSDSTSKVTHFLHYAIFEVLTLKNSARPNVCVRSVKHVPAPARRYLPSRRRGAGWTDNSCDSVRRRRRVSRHSELSRHQSPHVSRELTDSAPARSIDGKVSDVPVC